MFSKANLWLRFGFRNRSRKRPRVLKRFLASSEVVAHGRVSREVENGQLGEHAGKRGAHGCYFTTRVPLVPRTIVEKGRHGGAGRRIQPRPSSQVRARRSTGISRLDWGGARHGHRSSPRGFPVAPSRWDVARLYPAR